MTLLEYVAEKLMGPPVSRSKGCSTWVCPHHNDHRPSFVTRAPKPGYKDRFTCFGCGWWGDEYDLLREFYPSENFPLLQNRLDALSAEYRRAAKAGPEAAGVILPGTGSTKPTEGPRNDRRDLDGAWAEFMDDLRGWGLGQDFALSLLTKFSERCETNNVGMDALLKYWRDFDAWIAETDQQHLEECDDPQCDTIVCRAARGLPPLTPAELGAQPINGSSKRCEADNQQGLPEATAEMFALVNQGPAEWINGDRELDILRTFAFFAEIAKRNRVDLEMLAANAAKYIIAVKAERRTEQHVTRGNGRAK